MTDRPKRAAGAAARYLPLAQFADTGRGRRTYPDRYRLPTRTRAIGPVDDSGGLSGTAVHDWLQETVDTWQAARPGSGRHGARTLKKEVTFRCYLAPARPRYLQTRSAQATAPPRATNWATSAARTRRRRPTFTLGSRPSPSIV